MVGFLDEANGLSIDHVSHVFQNDTGMYVCMYVCSFLCVHIYIYIQKYMCVS